MFSNMGDHWMGFSHQHGDVFKWMCCIAHRYTWMLWLWGSVPPSPLCTATTNWSSPNWSSIICSNFAVFPHHLLGVTFYFKLLFCMPHFRDKCLWPPFLLDDMPLFSLPASNRWKWPGNLLAAKTTLFEWYSSILGTPKLSNFCLVGFWQDSFRSPPPRQNPRLYWISWLLRDEWPCWNTIYNPARANSQHYQQERIVTKRPPNLWWMSTFKYTFRFPQTEIGFDLQQFTWVLFLVFLSIFVPIFLTWNPCQEGRIQEDSSSKNWDS